MERTVPDHEAAIRFLEEAFDASVLYTHIRRSDPPATAKQVAKINAFAPGTAMLAASQIRFANGPNIEIFELEGYGREEATGINDMGLVHFSVIVEDIKASAARFEKAGGRMHSAEGPFDLSFNELGEGNTNWFGQMPWGTWVEFMTFRSPLRYDPGARRTLVSRTRLICSHAHPDLAHPISPKRRGPGPGCPEGGACKYDKTSYVK